MTKNTAIIGDERIEIVHDRNESNSVHARIGDRTYDVRTLSVEPGVFWFNLDGRSVEVVVTVFGDRYLVSVGGQQLPVEILDARTALKKATQHGHDGLIEVRAPMPGKVVKILLTEGAEVNANQGILVVEAMKMQNEIKSPKKGVIRRLGVTEGVAVNLGDLLASVE